LSLAVTRATADGRIAAYGEWVTSLLAPARNLRPGHFLTYQHLACIEFLGSAGDQPRRERRPYRAHAV